MPFKPSAPVADLPISMSALPTDDELAALIDFGIGVIDGPQQSVEAVEVLPSITSEVISQTELQVHKAAQMSLRGVRNGLRKQGKATRTALAGIVFRDYLIGEIIRRGIDDVTVSAITSYKTAAAIGEYTLDELNEHRQAWRDLNETLKSQGLKPKQITYLRQSSYGRALDVYDISVEIHDVDTSTKEGRKDAADMVKQDFDMFADAADAADVGLTVGLYVAYVKSGYSSTFFDPKPAKQAVKPVWNVANILLNMDARYGLTADMLEELAAVAEASAAILRASTSV
jgi:hypothetical protein